MEIVLELFHIGDGPHIGNFLEYIDSIHEINGKYLMRFILFEYKTGLGFKKMSDLIPVFPYLIYGDVTQ